MGDGSLSVSLNKNFRGGVGLFHMGVLLFLLGIIVRYGYLYTLAAFRK